MATSIHPELRRTASVREAYARGIYKDAKLSQRAGMFNPDAKRRNPPKRTSLMARRDAWDAMSEREKQGSRRPGSNNK